tara:strand:+ start:390 stop:848 length:459 start_codon:yes stop_codon:yes gene_type:complete
MSCFETVGYGYSKLLCEDIASWFINKYVPRHKFYVRIVHKGLKREHSFGFCDFVDQAYRPRVFVIEVQSNLSKEFYIKTLLHEFVHLRQWLQGTLKMRSGKMYFEGESVAKYEYMDQPHEVEAYDSEERLAREFLCDTYGKKFAEFIVGEKL